MSRSEVRETPGERPQSVGEADELELAVDGMTCASCAARVQRTLVRHPGVDSASVNLATNRARVLYRPQSATLEQLQKAVSKIGYRIDPVEALDADTESVHERDQKMWWRRVLISWPLGLAVFVLSLFAMHDPWARWTSFALTIPVQFYAGWPFIKTGFERVRSFSANMDTLIALGTLAAFFFSTYELFNGGDLYFDTAALIIAFIILGRYFEACAKGRASNAIKKLLELGARKLGWWSTVRSAWFLSSRSKSMTWCGFAPARRSLSTGSSRPASLQWMSRCLR